jgi:hypothetical protein
MPERRTFSKRPLARPPRRPCSRKKEEEELASFDDSFWGRFIYYALYVAMALLSAVLRSYRGIAGSLSTFLIMEAASILQRNWREKQGHSVEVLPRKSVKLLEQCWDMHDMVKHLQNIQQRAIARLAASAPHTSPFPWGAISNRKDITAEAEANRWSDCFDSIFGGDGVADLEAYESHQLAWKQRGLMADIMVLSTTIPGNAWEIVCGHVEVAASAQQLISLLADYRKRSSYDAKFKYSVHHRAIDISSAIPLPSLHTLVYSGAWPVADRQFHVLSAWSPWLFGDSEGAVISSRSVLPGAMPAPSVLGESLPDAAVHVRAGIHIAGFAICPILGEKVRCSVKMVSHVNFQGNIPAPIINLVQTKVMPEMLRKIKELAPLETPTPSIDAAFAEARRSGSQRQRDTNEKKHREA